ncbi:DNA cytosine methyltransferase [Vibrio fluvialis]|jgi:DNA (cytosine-5)-methyltransferase 1|uniref:DNA cytosine methyltransferase n=1 Tax=Vibrio fluvialis TaxID=676 RepID=UPI00257414DC|nr:DNA cytosine methyltransferase [Vibrio fluvialis]BEI26575.1 DNA cytosine methyltransferase [Vibrio fluvialis]
MATVINSKLGENRGKKRIWLEGRTLQREGYESGMKYDVKLEQSKVTLIPTPQGKYTISKRTKQDEILPIIDVCLAELAEIFQGVEMLRIQLTKGKIIVTAHFSHDKKQRREERLRQKILKGTALDVASFFHGGGVLDRSVHTGLQDCHIQSRIAVCNEIEPKYLEQSLKVNASMFDAESIIIQSPIELIDRTKQPNEVDFLIAGIPCTGASKAGRSKNKLEFAESHDAAGACFFSTLAMIDVLNPGCCVLENVGPYQNTASMEVIRSVLKSMGYQLHEAILDGSDFGCLERRKRLCVVALSDGIDEFSFENLKPVKTKESAIKDILEDIPLDSERYRSFDYLAKKEEADIKAGKGFRRQLLTGEEDGCGVLTKDYAKCRSTDPYFVHPTNDKLSRLFTPIEHCRVKGVPESMINGLSDTVAHQILGQSVCFPVFQSVARAVGDLINRWAFNSNSLAQAA